MNSFARFNGLAVLIIAHIGDCVEVRYCGHRGKTITRKPFIIRSSRLEKF